MGIITWKFEFELICVPSLRPTDPVVMYILYRLKALVYVALGESLLSAVNVNETRLVLEAATSEPRFSLSQEWNQFLTWRR